MLRDHRKLEVFQIADRLVDVVYDFTSVLPMEERFGLQSQRRRAAVSIPTNIVEGCQRISPRDYLRFLEIALGSGAELAYLVPLCARLGFVDQGPTESLEKALNKLVCKQRRLVLRASEFARSR